MIEERPDRRDEQQEKREGRVAREQPPETRKRPAPGVKHEPEPDGSNVVPTDDEPGTL
jgi:hypothetical protein